MNKNIEVINENLWAVNFYYVKMNCIKELKLLDENVDDIVKISIDGKMLLNRMYIKRMSSMIPVIVAIMKLEDKELHTKQGFCKVMRIIVPKAEKLPDNKIMNYVWKEEPDMWTTYRNICNWETTRRKAKKEYKKKYPFKTLKKKLYQERG